MDDTSLDRQEIIRLLRKLKDETPEYSPDLLEARKYSYLKQIVDLQVSRSDPPAGSSAGGSGRPGAALRGGGATFLGLPLKTVLAIAAAIVLLAAAAFFREEIVDFLAENGVIATEGAVPPLFALTPGGAERETPAPGATAAGGGATQAAPGQGNNGPAVTPAPEARDGPFSILDYLFCVLGSEPDRCR